MENKQLGERKRSIVRPLYQILLARVVGKPFWTSAHWKPREGLRRLPSKIKQDLLFVAAKIYTPYDFERTFAKTIVASMDESTLEISFRLLLFHFPCVSSLSLSPISSPFFFLLVCFCYVSGFVFVFVFVRTSKGHIPLGVQRLRRLEPMAVSQGI